MEAPARPMSESVEYATGIPIEARMERLRKANTFLPKVSNGINVFLSTRCDEARQDERSIGITDPDMECGTGVFHFWFCSDATISAGDTPARSVIVPDPKYQL